MGINVRVFQILNNGGYEKLTIFQKSVIPLALSGKNFIAETGKNSGKTLSYIIPSIIFSENSGPGPKIMIISPSADELKKIYNQFRIFLDKEHCDIKIASFFKEKNTNEESALLKKKPDILLSAPDKIIDHIRLGNLETENINIAVIDSGTLPCEEFINDIEFIISKLSAKTHYWIYTEDKKTIPLFSRLLPAHAVLYNEKRKKNINNAEKGKKERKSMKINKEEQDYSEIIKKIVKMIKEDKDPAELNRIRKIIRKNVSLPMRSYFSAYILRKMILKNRDKRPDKKYKTLFFNIGRTRGLNHQSLLRYIASTANIDNSEIGQIKIHDNYSFVDVDEKYVSAVIDELNSKVFRGRTLSVNFAKKNSEPEKSETAGTEQEK